MKLIDTMPNFSGRQIYHLGLFPLPPYMVHVNSNSVESIFYHLRHGEDGWEQQEHILRDYMLYYLAAPIWSIEDRDRVLERAEAADYDELWEILMAHGLDPF